MTHGKHESGTPSRWRKRIAGIPVAGWLLLAFAGTAAAVIGLIVTLGTSGTITASEDKIDVSYVTPSSILP